MAAFVWGADGTPSSPEDIKRRRLVAQLLTEKSLDTSPVQSWTQGLARVADGIAGAFQRGGIEADETASRAAQRESYAKALQLATGGAASGIAGGPSSLSAGDATVPDADGKGGTATSQAVNDTIPTYGRALLDTISGTESPAYNRVYGGQVFDSYAAHPDIRVPIASGPNAGKVSTAAGRYQMLAGTWNEQANKLGLKDFSPANQDAAAWDLAKTSYQRSTGRILDEDLQSGDPSKVASVGSALRGVWTSLPGGIEAGTNADRFAKSYAANVGRYGNTMTAPAVADAGATSTPSASVAGSVANAFQKAGIPTIQSVPPAPADPAMDARLPSDVETIVPELAGVSASPREAIQRAAQRVNGASPVPLPPVPGVQVASADPGFMPQDLVQRGPVPGATMDQQPGTGLPGQALAYAAPAGAVAPAATPVPAAPPAAAPSPGSTSIPAGRAQQIAALLTAGTQPAMPDARRQALASALRGPAASSGSSETEAAATSGPAQAAPPAGQRALSPQDIQTYADAMSNEWTTPGQSQMLGSLLSQRLKPIEYGFATAADGTVLRENPRTGQVDAAYQAAVKPIEVNGRLVNPNTGGVIADFHDRRTATVGDRIVDLDTGDTLYQGPVGKKFVQIDGRLVATDEQAGTATDVTPSGMPAPYREPTDEERERFHIPKNAPAKMTKDGPVLLNGASTIINNGSGPTGKVYDDMSKRSDDAQAAQQSLQGFATARQALDSGQIILGAGADMRLGLAKVGGMFGLPPEAAQNTETFRASMAPVVLGLVKGLGSGSGISNADRDFAERAAAGSISLEPGTIRRMIDIGQRAAEAKVRNFNAQLDDVYPEDDPGNAQVRNLFKLRPGAMPAPVVPPPVVTPPAPAAAAPAPQPQAPARSAEPVRVNSPAEAAQLPPGTVFITPDGRRKVR